MDKNKLAKRRKQLSKQVINAIKKHRTCGECKACCTVLGIKELGKGPYVPCTHLCAEGCSIYKLRPASCQIYECLWLQGNLTNEDLRPDKCGVIFDLPGTQVIQGATLVICREIEEASSDSELVQKVFSLMKNDYVIYILRKGSNRRSIIAKTPEIERQVIALLGQSNNIVKEEIKE